MVEASPARPTPIRILFLVPSLSVGGAERVVSTLVTRMDSTRFSPTVVCIYEEGEFFDEVRDAGIPAIALNLKGYNNALRALRRIVSIVRHGRFDVIVMRGLHAEFFGRIAAHAAGVENTVAWMHGSSPEADRPPLLQKIVRLLINRSEVKRYFGVADAQRRYMEEDLHYPPDRIRIIHNGVDSSRFSCENDRSALAEFGIFGDEPVVSIVARLVDEKDHETFLRAAKFLMADFPDIQFLVIGDGPKREALQKLANALGVARNIHFTGTRLDIAPLLRGTDVFVLSSHTEAFPLAVLEAMSCARPVVCTDVGGVGEMIDDGVTGFLVDSHNPTQLSATVKKLLLDRDFARRIGHNARRRIEKEFRLEVTVEAMQKAIEETVRSGVERS